MERTYHPTVTVDSILGFAQLVSLARIANDMFVIVEAAALIGIYQNALQSATDKGCQRLAVGVGLNVSGGVNAVVLPVVAQDNHTVAAVGVGAYIPYT